MVKPIPDFGNEEELNRYLRALEGERDVIKLTRDQAIKAAMLVASKRPCYVCAGQTEVVSTMMLPDQLGGDEGKFLVYGLCGPCKMTIGIKDLVRIKLTEEVESGEHQRRDSGSSLS